MIHFCKETKKIYAVQKIAFLEACNGAAIPKLFKILNRTK